jgi:hypothetical protein
MLASVAAGSPQLSSPEVHTDKETYLAGEPIQIIGSGFSPSDRITVQVTHADGTAEPSAGHEKFFVSTDAAGSFEANWSIDRRDVSGLKFVAAAESSDGSGDQAAFTRVGTISATVPAGTARVVAVGFNAGELVSVNMSGDRGRNPRQTLSDEEGIAVVELDLSEQENAALIHIIARGTVFLFSMKFATPMLLWNSGMLNANCHKTSSSRGPLKGGTIRIIPQKPARYSIRTGIAPSTSPCAVKYKPVMPLPPGSFRLRRRRHSFNATTRGKTAVATLTFLELRLNSELMSERGP